MNGAAVSGIWCEWKGRRGCGCGEDNTWLHTACHHKLRPPVNTSLTSNLIYFTELHQFSFYFFFSSYFFFFWYTLFSLFFNSVQASPWLPSPLNVRRGLLNFDRHKNTHAHTFVPTPHPDMGFCCHEQHIECRYILVIFIVRDACVLVSTVRKSYLTLLNKTLAAKFANFTVRLCLLTADVDLYYYHTSDNVG